MKRIFFIFSLLLCLLSVPVTGFAAETDEEQVKYEDATADNMKEMLKGSIALDKISAENKESLLNWLEAENKPEEAKKLVVRPEAPGGPGKGPGEYGSVYQGEKDL